MAADRAPGAALALERFVPYRLSVLSNTVSSRIAREYAGRFALTIPAWRVMAVLGRYPDLTASELAARTAMDKVQVSRALALLARQRRVRRAVDAADRRAVRLRLTQAGARVYRQIAPLALRLEARLLQALNAAEQDALDRLLARLQAAAEKL